MTQTAHTFTPPADDDAPSAESLGYWLHLPPSYRDDRLWPLVLFLHGVGERGRDLAQVQRYGLPAALVKQPDLPFLAISPQCPPETDWTPHMTTLLALIDEIAGRYAVDTRRIYLTGLSMGGRGAWHLAVLAPDRFAALAPVCGRIPDLPDFLQRICVLGDLPTWVFHGAQDDVVPLHNSEQMVAALRACGAHPRFTVYPDLAHDSWTATYDNPELYAWMLAQDRK
jgi:predicted peptidase